MAPPAPVSLPSAAADATVNPTRSAKVNPLAVGCVWERTHARAGWFGVAGLERSGGADAGSPLAPLSVLSSLRVCACDAVPRGAVPLRAVLERQERDRTHKTRPAGPPRSDRTRLLP